MPKFFDIIFTNSFTFCTLLGDPQFLHTKATFWATLSCFHPTTLCETNTSKQEEQCTNDDEDTKNDGEKAPNDNDYHESQPQNINPTIGHGSMSNITKALQSNII